MTGAAAMKAGDGSVILEEARPGVSVLRFNRPEKLNALDEDTIAEFTRALQAVEASTDTRVLILTGAGRGFCAGFDLSLVDSTPGVEAMGETAAWMMQQERFGGLVNQLRALRQPVIAAVNGAAAGAGFGLALAADIRLASRSAAFNAAFVKVGLSGCDIGVSYLLPRSVGLSRAFELLLTGRSVTADEALTMGLVSATVDDDDLLPRAFELADAIVANSAFGVWMTKRGVWANVESSSLQAAIELENRTQALARTTGDMSAAVKSFFAVRQNAAGDHE